MNFPIIPTDNLYKFVALGGLALMIFSVTYPTNKALELQLNTITLRAEIEKLKVEVENLDKDVSRAEKKKNDDLTDAEIKSLIKTLTEQKIKRIDVEANINKVDAQKHWLIAYLLAAGIGVMLGSFATFKGFSLWYSRVQKPNDQKIAEF